MSLETLCVKTEAEEVCVKKEVEEFDSEDTGAHVKEEAECEDSAALCELYADHQIKDELMLGPEEMHRPCVAPTLPVAVNRAEQALGRDCSVRLERLVVDAARRSCRVGPHTYTLRRASEPSDCADTASKTYQCDECGRSFKYKWRLRKHIHTRLLGHLSNSAQKDNYDSELKTKALDFKHEKDTYGVTSFMSTTGRKNTFRSHSRIVKNLLNCNHCSYSTVNKYHFQRHLFLIHCEKPHKCSFCLFTCCKKADLMKHERIHTGEKPFQCSRCDYKCRHKKFLKNHERIHTDEKTFQCSHCDYKCRRKGTLERHKRIHTDEKPFKCSHCDYKCRHKGNLERHNRMHSDEKPFKCSHCDFKCRHTGTLKYHERIHTDDKPFKCSLCDYKCRKKDYLKIHKRIHTGKKTHLNVGTVTTSSQSKEIYKDMRGHTLM